MFTAHGRSVCRSVTRAPCMIYHSTTYDSVLYYSVLYYSVLYSNCTAVLFSTTRLFYKKLGTYHIYVCDNSPYHFEVLLYTLSPITALDMSAHVLVLRSRWSRPAQGPSLRLSGRGPLSGSAGTETIA